MALTKIFTGMEQGPEKIDANFKSVEVIDSGWQRDGITFINGASASGDNYRYRVFQRESFGITVFSIGITMPSMNYGQTTNFVSLPAAMMSASVDMDFGNLVRTGRNQLAGWGFSSNNLFITAFGDWSSTTNDVTAKGYFIFKK